MQVSKLRVGDRARVVRMGAGEGLYRQRLMAMGLIPGTEFEVVRMAPLGDPIEILVRGYALSLRKKEADILEIASSGTVL